MFSLLALLIPGTFRAATLHIQVVDENGQAIWARLEVRGANEKEYHPVSAILTLPPGIIAPCLFIWEAS